MFFKLILVQLYHSLLNLISCNFKHSFSDAVTHAPHPDVVSQKPCLLASIMQFAYFHLRNGYTHLTISQVGDKQGATTYKTKPWTKS